MRPLKALLAAAASALVVTSSALAGPPPVRAAAYIVENGATGEVLASQDAGQRRAIASITKMMTVLVTLEHAKLDALVTVPEEVTTIGESTIFLRAGEHISVRDLIEAALIPSANDAADTLAYYVGHGSQARFVAMMNAKARELRLRDTHFVRPDGLDAPGHVSSARDVTKLARILMRRPVVRRIVRDTTANIEGGRTIYTRNTLLYSYPGLFGVKTGHTDLAGWSEVAAARRDGVTVYATILGSPTEEQRNADLASLLTWGLSRVPARDSHLDRRRLRPGCHRVRARLRRPRRSALARPARPRRATGRREGGRPARPRSAGAARPVGRPGPDLLRRPPRRRASTGDRPRGLRARPRKPRRLVRRADLLQPVRMDLVRLANVTGTAT